MIKPGCSLFEKRPDLLDELFDENINPKNVSYGSKQKAIWKCRKCQHKWTATIGNRNSGYGCPACAGKVVTNSNSFVFNYPDLLDEWDYVKNIMNPNSLSYGSHKITHWVCKECSYLFAAPLYERTCNKSGCPACLNKVVTDKNRLSMTYPDLLKEWDYDNNIINPENISYASSKEVIWKCYKCNHCWNAIISNRTQNNSNCPNCSGKVVNDSNRLTIVACHLLDEWNYEKNKEDPHNLSYGSDKIVSWRCKKCSYEWDISVGARKLNGCPACSGNVVTDLNRLTIVGKHLLDKWNYEKNKDINPHDLSIGSHKIVYWKCKNCNKSYQSSINKQYTKSKTNRMTCKFCSRLVICDENRLSTVRPYLMKEWNYEKNTIDPDNISYGSSKRAYWICSKCNNSWKSSIKSRSRGSACPKCARRTSKRANIWLTALNIPKENREIFRVINGKKRFFDAYDSSTNTVYEFYGDYWHGNPFNMNHNKMNNSVGKTFGQLYNETMEREKLILSQGYNLITIWENNWKNPDNLFYSN